MLSQELFRAIQSAAKLLFACHSVRPDSVHQTMNARPASGVPTCRARLRGRASTRPTPDTTKPPGGGFAPTTVDPYGQQFAGAGTILVAVTAKVSGVAMVNFT